MTSVISTFERMNVADAIWCRDQVGIFLIYAKKMSVMENQQISKVQSVPAGLIPKSRHQLINANWSKAYVQV